MFRRNLKLLIVVILLLPQASALGLYQQAPNHQIEGWSPVTPGIDFQVYRVSNPRPVKVYVARMDRSNITTTIESSIAQGKLAEGRETITGMFSSYNQAINYWGESWGGRNRVVVAIN